MGSSPQDLPITELIHYRDKSEDLIEGKILLQQAAIEAALQNFWEAIN